SHRRVSLTGLSFHHGGRWYVFSAVIRCPTTTAARVSAGSAWTSSPRRAGGGAPKTLGGLAPARTPPHHPHEPFSYSWLGAGRVSRNDCRAQRVCGVAARTQARCSARRRRNPTRAATPARLDRANRERSTAASGGRTKEASLC